MSDQLPQRNIPEKPSILREIYYFFTSRVFLRNTAAAIVGILIIGRLSFCALNCYTRHGKSMSVPDLVGMDYKKARQIVGSKYLRVQIMDSAAYNKDLPPMSIIEQEPKAGSKVKVNRTIYVTINPYNAGKVTLSPDLEGQDVKFVEAVLKSLQLEIGEKTYIPDKTENTVLQIKYKGKVLMDARDGKKAKEADLKIPQGSVVDLVISKGAGEEVPIPNLVCQPVEAARLQIASSDLIVGIIIGDGYISDTASAYIYKQTPEYDNYDRMRKGEAIELRITQRRPANCSDNLDIDTRPVIKEEENKKTENEETPKEEKPKTKAKITRKKDN